MLSKLINLAIISGTLCCSTLTLAVDCKNIKKVDISVLHDSAVLSQYDYSPSVYSNLIDFYAGGGQGDLIEYSGPGKSAGFYIQISKLPVLDSTLNDLIRRDPRLVEEVQSILDEGIPVFYSHIGRGVVARVNNAGIGIYDDAKSCGYIGNSPGFIEINSYTDLYSLKHELFHYRDVQSGLMASVKDTLKSLLKQEIIQETELMAIYLFIIEQRAYAHQVILLHQMTSQEEFSITDSKVDIIASTDFAKAQIDNRKKVFQNFVGRLATVLARVKVESPAYYLTVVNLIKKNTLASPDFDLEILLPEYFQPLPE